MRADDLKEVDELRNASDRKPWNRRSGEGSARPGTSHPRRPRGALPPVAVAFLSGSLSCGGLLGCGLAEGGAEDAREMATDDEGRPGLFALDGKEFPTSATLVVRSGKGFEDSGIEVPRGVPLVIRVRPQEGLSPWGEVDRIAGPGSPAPLRAHRALLLKFNERVIEVGNHSVIRTPEAGTLAFAINAAAGLEYQLSVFWGEPASPYNAQLSQIALDPEKALKTKATALESRSGAAVAQPLLADVPQGSRVRVRTRWFDPRGTQMRQDAARGLPFTRLLPAQDPGNRRPFPGLPERTLLAVAGDGQPLIAQDDTWWTLQSGGALQVRFNGGEAWKAETEVEVFPPLGTRVELLPTRAFNQSKRVAIKVRPRKFISTGMKIRAGDLVRIDSFGYNQHPQDRKDPALSAPQPHGRLSRVPEAKRSGERGWLVPGGRERGLYARIGDHLEELVGDDVFYAPVGGFLELGINQCFDGGDWPVYEACREKLEDLHVDMRAIIYVASAQSEKPRHAAVEPELGLRSGPRSGPLSGPRSGPAEGWGGVDGE